MNYEKYNYINSIEKLVETDKLLHNQDGSRKYDLLAVDTETNGLRIYKNAMVGFSFSFDSKSGFYVPLVEWIPDEKSKKTRTVNKQKYESYMKGHFKCVWTGKEYPEFFQPHEYEMHEIIPAIINKWFKGASLIMHNAPFDVNHMFIMTGVDLKESVLIDTALLSHILNENSPNGLKETASEWKDSLGFNSREDAAKERKELGESVIGNGGEVTPSGKPKTLWRASPEFMGKYACKDTALTFGLQEVGLEKFIDQFGADKLKWLFEDEVMPVCKEVVIPMKRKGVYLDIPFFEKCAREIKQKLEEKEDLIINEISEYLSDFSMGKSLDEAVSHQRLVKKIIELEGLEIPTKYDKKTDQHKQTLAKGEIKKVYQKDPHWIWGYIIGEDEIRYSDEKLLRIKKDLYREVEKQRYRFNIGSDYHLRWLFCDKLKFSKTSLPQTDSATKENPIPSMKAEVLEEHMLNDFPWVRHLLTFKKLRKMSSGYFIPALKLHIDGWLYMDMKQNGTTSGRFACSGGFNLQTLPRVDDELEMLETCKCGSDKVEIIHNIEALADRKCNECGHTEFDIPTASCIKKGFIAPPGYKIVNADYASLEPRCFSVVSCDDKLKEVYWHKLDLYSKVYCDMFDDHNEYSPDPKASNFLKKVAKVKRTEIKPIVLGIPYGSGAYQVAIMCNRYKDIVDRKTGEIRKVPDEKYGQWVIDKYLGTYKNLALYMEEMELGCLTNGYVESMFGRRRHFQYAPIIYRFLESKGLTHKDLIECKPFFLKSADVSLVSNLGNQMNFSKDELKNLIKSMGLDYFKCMKKGFWAYVRNLLKNDLNNSKNFPIQSLAGHITNRGMLDTARGYRKSDLDAWVFLQVHDEICCYVDEASTQQGSSILEKGMEENEFAKALDVPMIAKPVVCDSIKDAK